MKPRNITLKELRKKPTQKNFKSSGIFECFTTKVETQSHEVLLKHLLVIPNKKKSLKKEEKHLKYIEHLKRERARIEDLPNKTVKQIKRIQQNTITIGDNHTCEKCANLHQYKLTSKKRKNRTGRKREAGQYKTYINSREWENRKNAYYQKYEKRCAACLSYEHVALHHKKYGNLGKEEDNHLVPLCARCHKEYHDQNGTQKNMIRKTDLFIEYKLARLAA